MCFMIPEVNWYLPININIENNQREHTHVIINVIIRMRIQKGIRYDNANGVHRNEGRAKLVWYPADFRK